jgi:hypothetical protein
VPSTAGQGKRDADSAAVNRLIWADAPAIFNGSTYAVSVPKFLSGRSFYGSTMRGYDMPRHRSVDIDTRDDLELALYFAKARPTGARP